jgi:hypothetical protein
VTLAELLAKWHRRQLEDARLGGLVPLANVAAEVLADLEALAGADRPAVDIAPAPEAAEEWLTAEQCAKQLNVSVRWCYDHAAELGAKRLSRRCVRFSARAVAKRMARKSA